MSPTRYSQDGPGVQRELARISETPGLPALSGDELQIPHSVRDDKRFAELQPYSYLRASAGKIRAADHDG
jgi:hypothetical protein